MGGWLGFFRRVIKTDTEQVLKQLDEVERKRKLIERDIQRLKEKIDPLAELVEHRREDAHQ